MTDNDARQTDEAHDRPTEPELAVEDETAEQVVGGGTAQAPTPEQYRGRYQLRLGG
jgi:hypothetical protein